MDVKTAIETGDAAALRRLLAENESRANELIRWGEDCHITTHPLHFVSDMLFNGTLKAGLELPLVDALIEAGADLDFTKPDRGETPLIGAASLGAEEVGLRLLDAGARPELRGNFGDTALHWAAMMGVDRLVEKLIERGAPVDVKDEKYSSTPLGWALHGWGDGARNSPNYHIIVRRLVAAGAAVEPEWLAGEKARADPEMLVALGGTTTF